LLDPGHPELVRPTAIANVARYLALAVYPYPLVHLYGYAQVPLVGYDAPLTWLALALIAAGTLIILFGIPRRSPIAFGLFFFAATLAVYSNLWVTIPDTCRSWDSVLQRFTVWLFYFESTPTCLCRDIGKGRSQQGWF
jgi:hypothetical protein